MSRESGPDRSAPTCRKMSSTLRPNAFRAYFYTDGRQPFVPAASATPACFELSFGSLSFEAKRPFRRRFKSAPPSSDSKNITRTEVVCQENSWAPFRSRALRRDPHPAALARVHPRVKPYLFTHFRPARDSFPSLLGKVAEGRMGCRPLPPSKLDRTSVPASPPRASPAFHTPSGPSGHLPRFAEKGGALRLV